MAARIIPGRSLPYAPRTAARRLQLHSGPARLGQPDCNRLLSRARAKFALAKVIHLLLDDLSRLSAGSLTLAHIALSTLLRLVLWHAHLLLHSYRYEKIEQPASL